MTEESPNILIVSDSCISSAHGTGTLITRHFANYPQTKISQAYCFDLGQPEWERSRQFQCRRLGKTVPDFLLSTIAAAYNAAVRRLGLQDLVYHRPVMVTPGTLADAALPVPDLVYSVVNGDSGLALLEHLMAGLPTSVPLVHYFLDYQVSPGFRSTRYLSSVLARADEIWALTPEIAAKLESIAPLAKPITVQPGFHLDLPPAWKRNHRKATPDFRCVIVGNFWNPTMAAVVKRLWARVQRELPGLPAIQWLCHPAGIERVRRQGISFEHELAAGTFVTGDALIGALLDADMAIVPFNIERRPVDDYARYSLPSRLTEILSVGLPTFSIAGEETPLGRYITKNHLGAVCNGEDEQHLHERMIAFIMDPNARENAGTCARRLAEASFGLAPFQQALYERLRGAVIRKQEAQLTATTR